MRARPLCMAFAVAVLASCARSGGGSDLDPGTAAALLRRPGPDIALTAGTTDHAVGPVRLSFLVIDGQGRSVERARARVWVARSLREKPLLETTARLEDIGVPGVSEPAAGEISRIYVTHFRVPEPGRYVVVAEPVGGRPIQGALDLHVREKTEAPAVGSKAYPSRTPTIRSTGGDLQALTTRRPPDTELLRHSIAESLRDRVPFVVTFATPKFCMSRTCGPVVDVVDAVRRRFARTGVRFIHVEIFKDQSPALGTNEWVKQWRLPTEPFTFLVGRDGRIKASFEGSVSVHELDAAVRRHLLR